MSQWVHSGPSGAVLGDLGHDASSVKFLDAYSHRIGLDGSSTVNWEVRISGQQNLRSALQGQAHPSKFPMHGECQSSNAETEPVEKIERCTKDKWFPELSKVLHFSRYARL
jgi:hypothetical protein